MGTTIAIPQYLLYAWDFPSLRLPTEGQTHITISVMSSRNSQFNSCLNNSILILDPHDFHHTMKEVSVSHAVPYHLLFRLLDSRQ
jgi:hypothetical protein